MLIKHWDLYTFQRMTVIPQVSIAAGGGIPALLKRLQASQTDSQAVAASALWSLAQNKENQVGP